MAVKRIHPYVTGHAQRHTIQCIQHTITVIQVRHKPINTLHPHTHTKRTQPIGTTRKHATTGHTLPRAACCSVAWPGLEYNLNGAGYTHKCC
jgi:hypothetical protein